MSRTSVRPVFPGWSFRFIECWSDWMPWNVGRRNWRSFTVAHVDVEWARGEWFEVTFVLLGLGFCLDWNNPEHSAALEEMAEEL